jgi:hypothetical protein
MRKIRDESRKGSKDRSLRLWVPAFAGKTRSGAIACTHPIALVIEGRFIDGRAAAA